MKTTGMYRMWMLLVSLLCLVTAVGAQTADGPYIMYRTDGSVRMVSVTPEGRRKSFLSIT